jgi:hypothetical protein
MFATALLGQKFSGLTAGTLSAVGLFIPLSRLSDDVFEATQSSKVAHKLSKTDEFTTRAISTVVADQNTPIFRQPSASVLVVVHTKASTANLAGFPHLPGFVDDVNVRPLRLTHE